MLCYRMSSASLKKKFEFGTKHIEESRAHAQKFEQKKLNPH